MVGVAPPGGFGFAPPGAPPAGAPQVQDTRPLRRRLKRRRRTLRVRPALPRTPGPPAPAPYTPGPPGAAPNAGSVSTAPPPGFPPPGGGHGRLRAATWCRRHGASHPVNASTLSAAPWRSTKWAAASARPAEPHRTARPLQVSDAARREPASSATVVAPGTRRTRRLRRSTASKLRPPTEHRPKATARRPAGYGGAPPAGYGTPGPGGYGPPPGGAAMVHHRAAMVRHRAATVAHLADLHLTARPKAVTIRAAMRPKVPWSTEAPVRSRRCRRATLACATP